jgi:outer membrane lipoprotein SlyB
MMMKLFIKKISVMTMISTALISFSTPSFARSHNYNQYDDHYYQNSGYDDGRNDRDNRDYRDYRSQRCSKGTGGLIIGAIAGGLLGRAIISRRGDKTAGTIVGAGVGALAGRAVERSGGRRC